MQTGHVMCSTLNDDDDVLFGDSIDDHVLTWYVMLYTYSVGPDQAQHVGRTFFLSRLGQEV